MSLITTCSSLKMNMYSWRRLLQCQKVDAVTNKHKLRTDYKCETPAFVSGNSWQLHHKFWRNGALFWDYRQLAIDMAHSAWQEVMLLILKNDCALYLPETKGDLKVFLFTMVDEIGTREKLDKWFVQKQHSHHSGNQLTLDEHFWPWIGKPNQGSCRYWKLQSRVNTNRRSFYPFLENWSNVGWEKPIQVVILGATPGWYQIGRASCRERVLMPV